jgi:hypothetical protein
MKYYRAKGFLYAVYRGVKYIKWRSWCKKRDIDWRKFREDK